MSRNLLRIMYVEIFICFFFFNDTATTEIYTLSLHDALPISCHTFSGDCRHFGRDTEPERDFSGLIAEFRFRRSEEHTSELQSQSNLVCRLLLEKKKEDRAWRRPSGGRGGSRLPSGRGARHSL